MKNKFYAIIAFLGLSALVFTSCTKLPQSEIDTANAAIEQAKAAGAEIYAAESFQALQDSMNKVMVGIEAEKSKVFKNYDASIENLANVAELALNVAQVAETHKQEAKAELQNALTEVKGIIDANRQLVTEAPKGKEGATALVAISGEIDTIEASINEINTEAENFDYASSLDKVKAAKDKAASINTELTDVISKYNGKGKSKKS